MITVAFQGKVPPPSSTEPPLTFSWVTSHPPPRARGVHPPRVPIFLMVLSMPYVPHHLFPISPFSAHIYCIAHTPTGPCPDGVFFRPQKNTGRFGALFFITAAITVLAVGFVSPCLDSRPSQSANARPFPLFPPHHPQYSARCAKFPPPHWYSLICIGLRADANLILLGMGSAPYLAIFFVPCLAGTV